MKNPQLGTSTKNWIELISKEVQEKIGGKWPEIVHDICIFIAFFFSKIIPLFEARLWWRAGFFGVSEVVTYSRTDQIEIGHTLILIALINCHHVINLIILYNI